MTDSSTPLSMQQYVEKHFLWNFTVNAMDISFVTLAFNMVSQATILPLLVNDLTDSKIAVGLIPAIFSLGFLLPQLFTAGHAESLRRKKPFIVLWSAIGERTPYLVAAVAILLFAGNTPLLALGLIYLSLLVANGSGRGAQPCLVRYDRQSHPGQPAWAVDRSGQRRGSLHGHRRGGAGGLVPDPFRFPTEICPVFLYCGTVPFSFMGLPVADPRAGE